jgi:5'-3' exonuclease
MGIPSYFSYIIKNYSNIIKNLQYFKNNNVNFNSLYMDCNSIIYDSVHMLEKTINSGELELPEDIEYLIISTVIDKIKTYIEFIKPTKTLFIAFDGVAPFAKMEQQRTRRYKSWFISKNKFDDKEKKISWNTASITPGTQFMEKLSKAIDSEFHNKEKKYNLKNIIISCSDQKGEGEHKMYNYIRNNKSNENIAIYGLDADLIMLSILHLKYSGNIYIFRETPGYFKNVVLLENANNEPHFLDINNLSNSILSEMNCKYSTKNRIIDYVFICFFLGNDFLPHFPAMNIRTHGITALLDIYRNCIGNTENKYFINIENGKLEWNHIGLFIKQIAKGERQFLLNEYNVRSKFDNYTFKESSIEDKENILLNAPIIYRMDEKYICPQELYWEERYYKCLFNIDTKYDNIKKICKNYFEGLEWVYNYYTGYCIDWKWKYNYYYPPLFNDLCKFLPKNNDIILMKKMEMSISPYTQLCYVLPKSYHYLLPRPIEIYLNEKYKYYYPESYEFKWAFCRYFWEAHPILPEINIDEIEFHIIKNIDNEKLK